MFDNSMLGLQKASKSHTRAPYKKACVTKCRAPNLQLWLFGHSVTKSLPKCSGNFNGDVYVILLRKTMENNAGSKNMMKDCDKTMPTFMKTRLLRISVRKDVNV